MDLDSSSQDELDVVIIGAGVSGIGAAYQLQKQHPGKSYAILESRNDLGGTWDLFRYPGIRSDSDLYTFGYQFKPWTDEKAIADGPAIKAYINETAVEDCGDDDGYILLEWGDGDDIVQFDFQCTECLRQIQGG
ncbi:MAG TPA: FAD-dependent oxidoreductase [Solirubrobacterales bacterium]|nr:FAD-dependent oxidoreductase [Solirubrobacterales bacterium]